MEEDEVCELLVPGGVATPPPPTPPVLKLVLAPVERRFEGTGGAGMEVRPAAVGRSLRANNDAVVVVVVVVVVVAETSFSEPKRGRGMTGMEWWEESDAADTPLPLLVLEATPVPPPPPAPGVGEGAGMRGGKFPQVGRDATYERKSG